MRTPIKDTNNKTAALEYLETIMPTGTSIDSYCIFSGRSELHLADSRYVNCFTNSYVVYEFWRCVIESPEKIFQLLTCDDFSFDSPEFYNILQERWYTYKNPFLRSAFFFMLNRCSNTGLISSGELDQTNYTPLAIAEIKKFKAPHNFSINYIKQPAAEVSTLINLDTGSDFIYVPVGNFSYNLFEDGKSYGPEQTRINNRDMKKLLQEDKKIVLHYNFHKALQNFYKKFNTTLIDKYGKIVYDSKEAQEVIVANF